MKTTNALLCLVITSIFLASPLFAGDNARNFGGSPYAYGGYLPGGPYVSSVADKIMTGSVDVSGGSSVLAQKVREANDKYKDVTAAVAAGYMEMPCASGAAGGAMGIHFVNVDYLKDVKPDVARPQALMYEPAADGKMQLVAVEFIAMKGPVDLEGQLFQLIPAPNRYGLDNFYELHVWAWKDNPAGEFADNNPTVSCKFAKSTMSMK